MINPIIQHLVEAEELLWLATPAGIDPVHIARIKSCLVACLRRCIELDGSKALIEAAERAEDAEQKEDGGQK